MPAQKRDHQRLDGGGKSQHTRSRRNEPRETRKQIPGKKKREHQAVLERKWKRYRSRDHVKRGMGKTRCKEKKHHGQGHSGKTKIPWESTSSGPSIPPRKNEREGDPR